MRPVLSESAFASSMFLLIAMSAMGCSSSTLPVGLYGPPDGGSGNPIDGSPALDSGTSPPSPDAAVVDSSVLPNDGSTIPDGPDGSIPSEGGASPSTLVLFGGLSLGGGLLDDTWVWNGNSWSQALAASGDAGLSGASGPLARKRAVMSTVNGVAVLAGGLPSPLPADTLSDAWEWNGTMWHKAQSGPPARFGASAGTLGNTMYVFGGLDSTGNGTASLFSLQGGQWLQAPQSMGAGPSIRAKAVFANTPNGLLLFGGEYAAVTYNDTWLLTDSAWVQKNAAGPSPSARSFAAAAAWGTSVVLFGGLTNELVSGGQPVGDTWVWDGSTWTAVPQRAEGPPARWGAVMGSLNGEVVLFGGVTTPSSFLGDTWIWNGSWRQGPQFGPPARIDATMTGY